MGLFSKKRPKTELTNAQKAQLKRSRSLLDEEIGDSEKRLKAIARGKLGFKSLLAGTAQASQGPGNQGTMPLPGIGRETR